MNSSAEIVCVTRYEYQQLFDHRRHFPMLESLLCRSSLGGSLFGMLALFAQGEISPSLWVINILALVAGIAACGKQFLDWKREKSERDELVEHLSEEVKTWRNRYDSLNRNKRRRRNGKSDDSITNE